MENVSLLLMESFIRVVKQYQDLIPVETFTEHKLKGAYSLLSHRDGGVRSWVHIIVKAMGLVTASDYETIVQPAIKDWMPVRTMF